jgi:hypothetical protein
MLKAKKNQVGSDVDAAKELEAFERSSACLSQALANTPFEMTELEDPQLRAEFTEPNLPTAKD